MLTVSSKQMQAMDDYAINEIGIPSIVLMENAAIKVVNNIDFNNNDTFTVVCGIGNNGGDGLAIARHLILMDHQVDLFIVGNIDKATTDFKVNLNIIKNIDVKVHNVVDNDNLETLIKSLKSNDLLIDAIFGIGIDRNVKGLYYKVIDIINKNSKSVLSVDIPSGLNVDNGKVLGIAIMADQTICFHKLKKGLVNNKDYTGKVIVVDISIPNKATQHVLKENL